MKPGPKTHLNKDLFAKLKKAILDGKTLRDFAKENNIPESTVYTWSYDNYLNMSDKVEMWKRDRKLLLAERNIEGILCLPYEDKEVVRVVADMSKFVSETLGKDKGYSKRSELTGADGKDLPTPILGGITQVYESNKKENK